MAKKRRDTWERDGGAPHLFNKGPDSDALREAAYLLLHCAQHGNCTLCGIELGDRRGVNKDHVDPRAFGGDNTIFNVRLTHMECNRVRSRRPLNKVQAERVRQSAERLEQLLAALGLPAGRAL